MVVGQPHEPEPARLFAAVMSSAGCDTGPVIAALEQRHGPVSFRCGPLPFDFTEYYGPEMGPGLTKLYLVFEQGFDRTRLPAVKLATNAMEQERAVDGKRRVNIDPGYLARDKLVLATTKDFSHRLYLGQGIFGEVTLHYSKGSFRDFPWTYADYRVSQVQEMLAKARVELVGRLRG